MFLFFHADGHAKEMPKKILATDGQEISGKT
jgi:hypothetical protein